MRQEEKKVPLQAHQEALFTLLTEFDRVCKRLDIPYMLFAGTLIGAIRHRDFIPWDDDLDIIMARPDYDRLLREAESCLNREKFFLQKEFSPGWPMFFSKLRLNGTTCLEKYHPKCPDTHQGVYIDIFPYDNAAEGELGRKLQFYASKVVIAKSLFARGYETDSKKKKLFMAACRLLPMKPFLAFAKKGKFNSQKVHSFFAAASGYGKNVYPRAFFGETKPQAFHGGQFPVPVAYHDLLTTVYGDYMQLPPPEERVCKEHALLVDLDRSYEAYAHYRDGMVFQVYTRSIR